MTISAIHKNAFRTTVDRNESSETWMGVVIRDGVYIFSTSSLENSLIKISAGHTLGNITEVALFHVNIIPNLITFRPLGVPCMIRQSLLLALLAVSKFLTGMEVLCFSGTL